MTQMFQRKKQVTGGGWIKFQTKRSSGSSAATAYAKYKRRGVDVQLQNSQKQEVTETHLQQQLLRQKNK